MRDVGYKMNKIASAVAVALMPLVFATSAVANQDADRPANKKKVNDETEIIEVTSFRDSLTSSLNAKRNANSVIDALNADDIGSFPDNNVAESLQRIPGVSITRSLNGDGESISIRGFGPGKNLTLVNGQQMTSSSFNLENALSRGYNFGLLPSTLVQRVEVHKSSEAHLTEGGVGGTVNVITRKPLSQRKEHLFVLSGSGSYNTLSEETAPKLSGLGSWKVNDKFGALVSFDYFDRDSRRDAVEVLDYKPQTFTTAKGDTFSDVLVPGALGYANFNQNRERKTAMVTFQYQATDRLEMNLSYLTSEMEGDNLNSNLISLNHASFFGHNKADKVLDAVLDQETNTITRIDYAPNTGTKPWQPTEGVGYAAAIYRDAALETDSVNFDFTWLGDNLTIKGAIGSSESSGGAGEVNAIRTVIQGRTTVGIDDGIGYVHYHDANLADVSNNVTWAHGGAIINTENENDYATLDGEYYFDDNFVTSVMFGARYVESTQTRHHSLVSNDYHQVTDAHGRLRGLATTTELGTLSSTPSDFLDGINVQGIPDYQFLDPRDMQDFGIVYTEKAHLGNSFKVEEEITSFYVQANFEHEFDNVLLRGNAGLRYSDQKTSAFNFSNDLDVNDEDDLITANNFDFDVIRKGDTSKLLPSVNFIFDFQNNWVVRAAYSTVIARPAYEELARQFVVSDVDPDDPAQDGADVRATTGNVELEPFEADKYDLSVEWYYDEGASISLGAFYYDVKTFVTQEETIRTYPGDERTFYITQPVNVSGGSVQGVEAAFTHQFKSLPAPFDGLGAQLNYTYVDSDTKDINPLTDKSLPLPGLSKTTYNAVLFYSKEQWDARVSYNYRDSYYEQIQFGFPRFNDSIGRLTAKVKYKLDNGLSVYLQGTNLTDQQNKRYIGDSSRPYQTSEVGRNFVVGFNYKF